MHAALKRKLLGPLVFGLTMEVGGRYIYEFLQSLTWTNPKVLLGIFIVLFATSQSAVLWLVWSKAGRRPPELERKKTTAAIEEERKKATAAIEEERKKAIAAIEAEHKKAIDASKRLYARRTPCRGGARVKPQKW
jgi:hypothetical protein